ncbi:hypothetical protein EDB81DRAFT_665478 [Dactylonectria macrodidyma]|uniref:Fungal STAND N-terminal Goodbye domain-containing protein n=1 Tax=Dactylonectria macrodidyma TaxID=307937 RepID=A0A9P9DPG1_9HYPO|nr:hypothetical protein EDB81DRAFT_665478 [Dactylonectria macrodidyma]
MSAKVDEPPGYSLHAQSGIQTQFSNIVTSAAKRFADVSGSKLEDFLNPPLRSIDELTRRIDSQNGDFESFRARRQTIFSTLAAALSPIETAGEILAGAASDTFSPAQGIFGVVAYLIGGARDVSGIYDAIVELFELLKDFTGRLDVYIKHTMSASLREKLVAILTTLFEVLVLATKQIKRGRVKAYFKSLFGSESPVQPALDQLKALTLGEERQVIADTYGGVSDIKDTTNRVEAIVTEVDRNVASLRKEASLLRAEARERTNAAHKDKLKEILEPSPFPEDFFSAFNKSRVEGTGDWILEDESLQSWLQTETPYLWISGAAGTGKSFLTTRLISWGLEKLSHLGYFYFRDNNPETRSVLQALRDVAYQLSEGDAFYAKQLLKLLQSGDEIKTIPSAFRKLLVQPFQEDLRDKTIFIFFDGIDEADQGDIAELLDQLSAGDDDDTQRPPHCKVQVALIGRAHLTETVSFALDPMAEGTVVTTLHVTPDRNVHDVNSFITESVLRSRVLSRLSDEFKYNIIEAMVSQVDGLFILAKFMLEEINRRRHPRSILQSLQSYPKEINGMLTRSLKSLSATMADDEEAKDLNEMLSWVACAEEVLSLEQLEAVLILKFGDPPFRLEETLRGTYACFFELEREDGLTTDDLIKEHERKQRSNEGFGSGSRSSSARRPSSSGARRPSSTGSASRPSRPSIFASSEGQLDLMRNLSPKGRHRSPVSQLSSNPSPIRSPGRSPVRPYSPITTPDLLDPMNEMEFRSNKSSTRVSFFHTSVKEFFSKVNSTTKSETGGPAIGFDPTVARVHILKTCLSIFTDPAWFGKFNLGEGRQAIKDYAAWYWQEHVAAIDPATIPAANKHELGTQIYKMLTDDAVILSWSILYEKNNEGLEVLTDANIKGIRKWMKDPDVVSGLNPEAKEWVAKGVTESPGIFKPIGDLYAKAWLSNEFHMYTPTQFCFKIVHAIAFMQEGYSWSHTNRHWTDVPVMQRIVKAEKWARIPKTAHYHRRLGSTYLVNGMHSEALMHYDEALALDHNSVETKGRIAYCLSKDGRFPEAVQRALECEAIELESIAGGKLDADALKSTKWRLYKDHILLAYCYSELGDSENALKYFKAAVKSSKEANLGPVETFDSEVGYLELLAVENRHADVMKFLHELSSEVTDKESDRTRLVDILLEEHNKPIVIDWIPRAASKAEDAAFMIDQLEFSIELAREVIRDPLKAMYLRHSLGTTHAYSRDIKKAIELFEGVAFIEYRPRGNVPTRQAYALAFQKLALLYKEEVLHAGLKTPEARVWIKKLERVQIQQSKHQNQDMPLNMVGSDINVAAIYLALFYRLLGRKEEADGMLRKLIIDSLNILSDDDAQNDEYALDNLLSLLIAADDIENARALSQSMRKLDPQVLATSPIDSPVLQRLEPKLPEIQSMQHSCAQCLDYISPTQEYSMCEYCMESYCGKCLEVIKQDGNKTTDHRSDLICRSDHVWFAVPPLTRVLHRGEILLVDGRVASFNEWKTGLQKRWNV